MDCKNCNKPINNPNKRFCNSSCAASFNNKNRKVSPETKKKISNSLKFHLDEDRIMELYSTGKTQKEIASELGVSRSAIGDLLRSKGIVRITGMCSIHNIPLSTTKNKNYCKKCNINYVNERRRELKRKAVEYKGGKCECCAYDKCIAALEFHHLDPSKKDFGIANGNTPSWDKIKSELDKCIMVCANCHREIHDKERKE